MKTSTMLLLGLGIGGGVLLLTKRGNAASGSSGTPASPAGGGSATGDIFAGAKPWNGTTGQGNAVAPSSGSHDEKSIVDKGKEYADKALSTYQKGSAEYDLAKKCADGDYAACLQMGNDALKMF